jgi:putative addiction module killer protein
MAMVEVTETHEFARWIDSLKDLQAQARILTRINRLILGHPGDARPVGEGISELRIDYGPGYRIYYCQRGDALLILLAGGNKNTQNTDIQTALKLAREA